MSDQILHVSGFVRDGETRPSGVKVTTYDGALSEVANGVLGKISERYDVDTQLTRTLDGWLVEVHAFVDVNGTEMWHVFTTASDQWSRTEATS